MTLYLLLLQNVAKFAGHAGPITSMSFSENGYTPMPSPLSSTVLLRQRRLIKSVEAACPNPRCRYFLATSASDGVKLWDLRKLKNFRTLTPYEGGAPCTSVNFDHSGVHLATVVPAPAVRCIISLTGLPCDAPMNLGSKLAALGLCSCLFSPVVCPCRPVLGHGRRRRTGLWRQAGLERAANLP